MNHYMDGNQFFGMHYAAWPFWLFCAVAIVALVALLRRSGGRKNDSL